MRAGSLGWPLVGPLYRGCCNTFFFITEEGFFFPNSRGHFTCSSKPMSGFFQRNIYPFIDFKILKPLVVTEIFQGIPQNDTKLRSNTYDTIEVSTMKLFRYVKPQGVIRAHQKILRLRSRVDPDLEIFHTGKLGYRVEVHEDKNMAQLDLQERCSSTAI